MRLEWKIKEWFNISGRTRGNIRYESRRFRWKDSIRMNVYEIGKHIWTVDWTFEFHKQLSVFARRDLMWNKDSYIKGGTLAVLKYDPEVNTWTQKGREWAVEKALQLEFNNLHLSSTIAGIIKIWRLCWRGRVMGEGRNASKF
jgi:hypothetical protein